MRKYSREKEGNTDKKEGKREHRDKSLPAPKNMRSPGKNDEKKGGHGRYNWGPLMDKTLVEEGRSA